MFYVASIDTTLCIGSQIRKPEHIKCTTFPCYATYPFIYFYIYTPTLTYVHTTPHAVGLGNSLLDILAVQFHISLHRMSNFGT